MLVVNIPRFGRSGSGCPSLWAHARIVVHSQRNKTRKTRQHKTGPGETPAQSVMMETPTTHRSFTDAGGEAFGLGVRRGARVRERGDLRGIRSEREGDGERH